MRTNIIRTDTRWRLCSNAPIDKNIHTHARRFTVLRFYTHTHTHTYAHNHDTCVLVSLILIVKPLPNMILLSTGCLNITADLEQLNSVVCIEYVAVCVFVQCWSQKTSVWSRFFCVNMCAFVCVWVTYGYLSGPTGCAQCVSVCVYSTGLSLTVHTSYTHVAMWQGQCDTLRCEHSWIDLFVFVSDLVLAVDISPSIKE